LKEQDEHDYDSLDSKIELRRDTTRENPGIHGLDDKNPNCAQEQGEPSTIKGRATDDNRQDCV